MATGRTRGLRRALFVLSVGVLVAVGLPVVALEVSQAVSARHRGTTVAADLRLYRQLVVADGAVAYWRLGDKPRATAFRDGAPRGIPATIRGPVTLGRPGAVSEDPITSAAFEAGSYGEVPVAQAAPLRATSAVTVELWIRTTSTRPSPRVMQFYDEAAPWQGYGLGLNMDPASPGTVAFWDGRSWVGSRSAVNDGQWHDVVATFDAGTVDLSVDGTLDATQSGLPATLAANPAGDGFGHLDGEMAEVAVYLAALSPAQVTRHFQAATSAYRSAVLQSGPVGYWRLDDQPSSPTVEDSSSRHEDATVHGPIALGISEGAIEDRSSSAAFTTASYAEVPAAEAGALEVTTAVSVELWLRTTSTVASPRLLQFYDDAARSKGYGLGLNMQPDRPGSVAFWDGREWVGGRSAVNDGQWHDVVATFDARSVDLFVDGTLDATVAGAPDSLEPNPAGDTFGHFSGDLAEVAVYPQALTPTQVAAHFEAGRSFSHSVALAAGPVGYWRLGDPVGNTTATDDSTMRTAGLVKGVVDFGQPGTGGGDPETAARFLGAASSSITIPAPSVAPFRLRGPLTLVLWLKTTTQTPAPGLLQFSGAPGRRDGYGLGLNVGSPGTVSFWDGDAWSASDQAVNDGRWHQIVATFDAGTVRFYRDGRADGVVTGLPPTLGANPGADSFGNVDATLSGVAVYDYALSPAQVAMQAGAGGSGLVTRYGSWLAIKDRLVSFTGFNGPGVPTAAPDEGTLSCGEIFTDRFDQSFFASLPPDQLVRVWLFQAFAVTQGASPELDWTGMDRLVGYAREYRQHLDVVLANQWPACDNGVGHDLSWYQGGFAAVVPGLRDANVTSYAAWVQAIVSRYGHNPAIAMWEPLNEEAAPAGDGSCDEATATQALLAFNAWFVSVVHRYGAGQLTSSGQDGGGCGADTTADWVATQEPFDVWSLHFYPDGAPLAWAEGLVTAARQDGRPVIVGETGINVGEPLPAPATPPCDTVTAEDRATMFQVQLPQLFGAGAAAQLFWNVSPASPSPAACSTAIPLGDPTFTLLEAA